MLSQGQRPIKSGDEKVGDEKVAATKNGYNPSPPRTATTERNLTELPSIPSSDGPSFGGCHLFLSTFDLLGVFVRLHGKRLVSPLAEMSVADFSAMLLPPFDVRVRQLLHERWEVAVVLRPQDEVPMIAHPTKCANPHRPHPQRILDHALEGHEVNISIKEISPPYTTIQYVKDHAARYKSCWSWHDIGLPNLAVFVNCGGCHLFLARLFLSTFSSHLFLSPFPLTFSSPCGDKTQHVSREGIPMARKYS